MPDGTAPIDLSEDLKPKSEFCLSNDHLSYVLQHLETIEQAFNEQRFPSLGMNWDQVYPMLYLDGKTVIMVKKSRNVEPARVLLDIQKEEYAALGKSETRFA
jgi:hypothetical protein